MPVVHCDPSRKRSHRNAILTELREQQEIAMADMRDPETPAHVRSQLMRAYVELQKQRNVERMRPAPKPIDVSDRAKRKPRSHAVPVVDVTPEPPAAPSAPAPGKPA